MMTRPTDDELKEAIRFTEESARAVLAMGHINEEWEKLQDREGMAVVKARAARKALEWAAGLDTPGAKQFGRLMCQMRMLDDQEKAHRDEKERE